ncbi:hypothetical protein [Trichlorobacter ammonificans]|nr:hypothetical protein [Trichlorobacter ammonificans]
MNNKLANIRCKIIICALVILIISLYLAVNINKSDSVYNVDNNVSMNSTIIDTSRYWNSIHLYEKFIVSLENNKYGYEYNEGYPLYLGTIASMYLELYRKYRTDYYRNKLERVLRYIIQVKNADWTWNMSSFAGTNSLYNSFFGKIFLDVYRETNNKIYLDYAEKTIKSLDKFYVKQRLVTKTNNGEYETYNPNFFAFTTIAYYCDLTSECPENLYNMAVNLFKHSLRGYHGSSGLWDYDSLSNTKYRKYLKKLPHQLFYNSHDAFYSMILLSSFLENKKSIKKIFPDLYDIFYSEIPKISNGVKKYMLTDIATFNYDSEAPRCVECCADTALAFYLIDKEFGTNNNPIISNALAVIIKNQDNSGVYYKSDGENGVLLWYSDNIADKLPRLLNEMETSRCSRCHDNRP